LVVLWEPWFKCDWHEDLMVVEADESDRSFHADPTIAVVTNIDREHMDYYHDMDDVRAASQILEQGALYGSSVLCLDDSNVSNHPVA
jgi:UDP-N-acetylmuramate--alanine ligase